jgi:hypothetical protein
MTGIGLMVMFIACGLLLAVVLLVRSGNVVVRALGILLALAICGALLLPYLEHTERPSRPRCMFNLSQIGKAAEMFAMDNGERLPTSLGELTRYLDSVEMFHCSAKGTPGSITNVDAWSGYIIVTNANPGSADCVLVYCNPANHKDGTFVLYTDHSVTWINTADFASLGVNVRNLSRAGTNTDVRGGLSMPPRE